MEMNHVFHTSTPARAHHSSAPYDDEEVDLFFDEYTTNPYLSLGLTPASQLSPEHDFGYFPGLPPPISPAINDSSYSISVDGPLVTGNPVALQDLPSSNGSVRRVVRTGPRDLKELSLSRTKLETVPEHSDSSSMDVAYRRASKSSEGFKWSQENENPSKPGSLSRFSPSENQDLIFPSASLSLGHGSQTSNTKGNKGILPSKLPVTNGTTSPQDGHMLPSPYHRTNDNTLSFPVTKPRILEDMEPERDNPSIIQQPLWASEPAAQRERYRQMIVEEERLKRREQERQSYRKVGPDVEFFNELYGGGSHTSDLWSPQPRSSTSHSSGSANIVRSPSLPPQPSKSGKRMSSPASPISPLDYCGQTTDEFSSYDQVTSL